MIRIIDTYSGNTRSADFEKLVLEGYKGIIFKAGQGELSDVPRVQPEWWIAAKRAGLHRGWYWLKDSRHRPSLEIEALKRATNLDFGELGMWVDVEKPVLSMKEQAYWTTPYSGYDDVYDFMVRIQNTKASWFNENLPGIYTSPGFWKFLNVPPASAQWFAKAPLWTAQYPWMWSEASKPTLYGAWKTWTLWQYREGPDINLFNGTEEDYKAFFRGPWPSPTNEPKPIPAPAPSLPTITIKGRVNLVIEDE